MECWGGVGWWVDMQRAGWAVHTDGLQAGCGGPEKGPALCVSGLKGHT